MMIRKLRLPLVLTGVILFAAILFSYGFFSHPQKAEAQSSQARIFITNGSTFVVPDDWTSENSIEVIGGGGGGGGAGGNNWNGGGGGAYSKVTNVNLSPGQSVSYSVGIWGEGGAGNSLEFNGKDTWFNGSSCAGSTLCAKGGTGATCHSSSCTQFGGQASQGVGTLKYNGGNGGNPIGGGGGAGGPNGPGAMGGTPSGGAGGGGWDGAHAAGTGGAGASYGFPGGQYGSGGGGSNGRLGGAHGASGLIVITYTRALPTKTTVVLTSGSSWTVPADWSTYNNNTIEVIGGGGGGGGGGGYANPSQYSGGGGGGGGYSRISNTTLTPGATISFHIGSGGAAGSISHDGGAGGDTWFGGTSYDGASVGAKGGAQGLWGWNHGLGGAGGSSAEGAGSVKYSGGHGGRGEDYEVSTGFGAGGGAAAGKNGPGSAGDPGGESMTAGGQANAGNGGAGGVHVAGENGTEYGTQGSGGGGGGGFEDGLSVRHDGLPGGLYGGGGGGGPTFGDNGGAGRQGAVIITYWRTGPPPEPPPPPPINASCSVTFDQNPVQAGTGTTIRWASSGGEWFYINSIGYVTPSGSAFVQPSQTTNYAGSVGHTANGVDVTDAVCSDATLTVSSAPLTCPSGQHVSGNQCLCDSSNISPVNGQCTALVCPLGFSPVGNTCVFVGCPNGYSLQGGVCVPNPVCPQFYCAGPNNADLYQNNAQCVGSKVQSCAWGCGVGQCLEAPHGTGDIRGAPVLVRQGEAAVITWSTTNMKPGSCTVTENNPVITDSGVGANGSFTTSVINTRTTYTLRCTDVGDRPFVDTVTITIVPVFQET